MSLSEMLLPEFDQIVQATRKVLERVPDDRLDWQPHEKSFSIGDLAMHVANIVGWTEATLEQDELDVEPVEGEAWKTPTYESSADILREFDKNAATGKASLAASDDARFMEEWSLKRRGETLMAMPKLAVLRNWVLNHIVHHRAQLGVYLRLLDVPVPQTMGPTADEPDFM